MLRATHASEFFTDAPIEVMPASWKDTGSGVVTFAAMAAVLGSTSVVADSGQTLLGTYLSAVLLIGLLLNATVEWWWADPLAAVVIAALALREGREAWRGERCCDDDACTD